MAMLLLVCPGVCFSEQYLCVADMMAGSIYEESTKEWMSAEFKAGGRKWIISPSKDGRNFYDLKKMGDSVALAGCKEDFSSHGFLFCEGVGFYFGFNKHNGRYTRSSVFGYYNVVPKKNDMTDEESDTPVIEIGKCSSF